MRNNAYQARKDQSEREYAFFFNLKFTDWKDSARQARINKNSNRYPDYGSNRNASKQTVKHHPIGHLRTKQQEHDRNFKVRNHGANNQSWETQVYFSANLVNDICEGVMKRSDRQIKTLPISYGFRL